MQEIALRFLIGGLVVSAFAFLGDILKPKSFAGLLGAAPSVALASLCLSIANDGITYASLAARSMIAGSLAFLAYASFLSWFLKRSRVSSARATAASLVVWFAVAFALWSVWLR